MAAASRATAGSSTTTRTLVGTAGHLHPGGLWTDLKVTRGGRTVEVFRSRAHYYEPAGAVSWDVSMTATPPNWRVAVKKGDVLSVSGTYDSRTTSWYESMAIMPVAMTVAPAGGADPFTTNTAVKGVLTHGHLPENDHHGGAPGTLPDATKLPDGPRTPTVDIAGFAYEQGDLSSHRRAGPPARGQPRPAADLRQRRRRAERLPHDHRVPRAVHGDDRDRLPAGRRLRRGSTRASSASGPRASRRPPTARSGRLRRP